MCGIVGYVGKQQAYPILIKGLHRLEYRGYDSAGLALVNREGVLNVFKSKGKVADLEHFVESKDLDGTIGIAHTRWATHGEPNDINAHPHYSDSGNIALIHNGIIENYRVLKEALIENGYTFKSDTDTEVLVNLIEYIRTSNNCTLLEAVQQALKQVIGAYAIAVVEKGNQDQIIAARRSSPMVIGIGDKEFFLASDAASIVEYTDKIVYVNDGEVVVMDRNHPLKIVTLDNQESKIDIKKLQLSISQLEKGGYPHFMLKEIFEQPKTIVDCIRGRINPETYDVILSGIMDNRERFLNARRIIFVACGTSWHASLIGEYLIEDFCRIPVEVEYASEFRYRNPVIYPDDIVIAVSQSGETADTLAAIELAKQNGAFVYGICNVIGSSIARATDSGTYIHVGPEIGVASTKAFTGQVTVLTMLALMIARVKGTIDQECSRKIAKHLLDPPERPDRRLLENLHLRAQLHLPGTRVQLPHGAGRCAQTQGDLLHPRRGLPCRRNETRSDRPDRRRDADHRHRDAGSHLRKDRQQHRGDQGPGRQGYHRDRQGRRAGTQELRLLYRSARRGGVPDADRGIGAVAVAGVSYRCQ